MKKDKLRKRIKSNQAFTMQDLVIAIMVLLLFVGTIGTYYLLNLLNYSGSIETISGIVGLACTFISYLILNKKDIIPKRTSGGLDTVAIRMPSNIPKITKIIEE